MRRQLMMLALVLLTAMMAVGAAPAKFWWTTFQGNPSHTGYAPVTLNPKHFQLDWQRTFESGRHLNPAVVADGKVLVAEVAYYGLSAGLYALNSATGDRIWSVDLGIHNSVNPPSYAYGNVYIQTENHTPNTYLWAFEADSGSLVFRSPHAAQWESYYAPTIYDGTVYINGGYFGGMYAFDAFDGKQKWYARLPQYDLWTPAVDENWAYAYLGEYSPALYVLDRSTGVLTFSIPDPNFEWNGWSMRLAPVLGDNQDVFVVHDGRLVSFDIAERSIRWEVQETFSGQPTLARGTLYAINAGALDARDQETGESLWNWKPATETLTAPIIATNSHLFVQSEMRVYAVDISKHRAVWSYPVTGHLAYGEGALYIAGESGVLTAIRLRAGPHDR